MTNELDDKRQYRLDAAAEEQIRDATINILRHSFQALTEDRVLPRPRHSPWIQVGRDYFGDTVRGHGEQLGKILEESLPARFEMHGGDYVDLPWNYAYSVLEAAIAAATTAGEPYSVASTSVEDVVNQFITKLQEVPRTTVLKVAADIDVVEYADPRSQKSIEIAGVRVISVGNLAERFIEQELPSAGHEVDSAHRIPAYHGPISLLVSTIAAADDYGDRVKVARKRIDEFISAVRLASASTMHAVMDIEGDPDFVRSTHPHITQQPSWGFRLAYRPVTLSEAAGPGLSRLASLVSSWTGQGEWIPVGIAASRLNRSLDGHVPGLIDQVVDLAIGMEAALTGTDHTEVALRLRTRAADLLATDDDPPDSIYRDVKTLYDLRSTFVHGGSIRGKGLGKAISSVARTTETRFFAEKYLLALDRWRDLLRRAILARIALTTARVPWDAGGSPRQRLDVDQLLLRDGEREAWRQHIRDFWDWQGLPNAFRTASPARLTIRNSQG